MKFGARRNWGNRPFSSSCAGLTRASMLRGDSGQRASLVEAYSPHRLAGSTRQSMPPRNRMDPRVKPGVTSEQSDANYPLHRAN
jgi:hypothetical protein